MVDDGLKREYDSDADCATARRRAKRPRNNRSANTSGSGENQLNLLLEATQAEVGQPANRVHPGPDAPGEQQVFPGYLHCLGGGDVQAVVAGPKNPVLEYRGVDFEGGKYPCNNTFLLSAGQGITFSTAVGRNFESKALTALAGGKHFSVPTLMAMAQARRLAQAGVEQEFLRAVWWDGKAELMPTKGKGNDASKPDFKGMDRAKATRWRLAFSAEKPMEAPGPPLTNEEWKQVGRALFGELPVPEEPEVDDEPNE